MGTATSAIWLHPLPERGNPCFGIDHPYFEEVYASSLGPTAILIARAMGRRIAAAGGMVEVDPVDLAREVGVRASQTEVVGGRSRLARAIGRLVHAGLVVRSGDNSLGVHLTVSPLSDEALGTASDRVRLAHKRYLSEAD